MKKSRKKHKLISALYSDEKKISYSAFTDIFQKQKKYIQK